MKISDVGTENVSLTVALLLSQHNELYALDTASELFESEAIHNLGFFKPCSDIIVANRLNDEFSDVSPRVYTCDLFGRD